MTCRWLRSPRRCARSRSRTTRSWYAGGDSSFLQTFPRIRTRPRKPWPSPSRRIARIAGSSGHRTGQDGSLMGLRDDALALIASVLPSDYGDPRFSLLIGDMYREGPGAGTTCGFLPSFVLLMLGCISPAIINRNAFEY